MTTEEKLRAFILSKYKSVLEFTQAIDMPYGTIQSIFKRGIQNSSVTNIIKICQALGISTDDLAQGNIVPASKTIPEPSKIEDILENTKRELISTPLLSMNGEPASDNDIKIILDGIDAALQIAVKNQKRRLDAYYAQFNKEMGMKADDN